MEKLSGTFTKILGFLIRKEINMKLTVTMTAAELALSAFYAVYCNAEIGQEPDCTGCEECGRTPAGRRICLHPEHPENKNVRRETAQGATQ